MSLIGRRRVRLDDVPDPAVDVAREATARIVRAVELTDDALTRGHGSCGHVDALLDIRNALRGRA